jgi:CheY-like chemotaxis protein
MQGMGAGRKILIVDDDPIVAETMELVFSRRGYDVRSAHSAEDAIAVLADWKPDVALLDVMLPQMNGVDLGILLELNYPDCRVLLLSGHPGTAELLEAAKKRGHDFDILAKPLHPAFILDAVSELLPAPGESPAQA